METPMNYALRLLKIKNYYIKEMHDKLIKKYSVSDANKCIKELINNDYLNDKELVYLKMNYLIKDKLYGRNYIINYFIKKNISNNLVLYNLNRFDENIFEQNKDILVKRLLSKEKDLNHIELYLLRKGYNRE